LIFQGTFRRSEFSTKNQEETPDFSILFRFLFKSHPQPQFFFFFFAIFLSLLILILLSQKPLSRVYLISFSSQLKKS